MTGSRSFASSWRRPPTWWSPSAAPCPASTATGSRGPSCCRYRIDFDLKSDDGIAKFREFVEEAADMVVSFGGSLSGEHGDGQSRAELLPISDRLRPEER